MRVFVYGSLLKGLHNHRVLRGAKFLGEARTLEAHFTLHDLGQFPAVTCDGVDTIKGEVYEVDKETAERLDHLEGYPNFYDRKLVEVYEFGPCRMYFLHKCDAPIVPDGDWKRCVAA